MPNLAHVLTYKHLFHQLNYSSHVFVPRISFLPTPGPHTMLPDNSSFSLEKHRKLCLALNLRHDQFASSYTCDWPTRKCSTHSTIVQKNRPYVKNRLRPKLVLFFIIVGYSCSNNIERGPGEWPRSISLKERPYFFEERLTKTLNGFWGKIA